MSIGVQSATTFHNNKVSEQAYFEPKAGCDLKIWEQPTLSFGYFKECNKLLHAEVAVKRGGGEGGGQFLS